MSLLPWGVSSGMSPFEDMYSPWSISPVSRMERMNMDAMNMMDRMVNMGMANPMRRMEGELGKLISSVKDDENSFQVMVDVSQFRPNEVTVKTTDKNIVVHGRHEERTDQHGYVSRE